MTGAEVLESYWTVGLRPLWILLSAGYFTAATYIVVSRHNYPPWTWTTYYFISIAVLLFFNVDYWELGPMIMHMIEFLLWVAGASGGLVLFIILLSIGDEVDSGLIALPSFRELPDFLLDWLNGLK